MEFLKKIYNSKETQNEKGRVYYFDNLKFILVFLVVFGHFLDPLTSTNDKARAIWIFISLFHMPLFIFISGYFSKKAVEYKNKSKICIFFILYIALRVISFSMERFVYQREVTLNLFTAKSVEWYLFAMGVWYAVSMLTSKTNKKYIFIFNIILGLIIGYDKSFGDQFCLSRIITFYPFFLLGTMVNKEKLESVLKNKKVKLISIIFLISVICVCFLFINNIYFIRPLLTARNSYYSLNNSIEDFGFLLRLAWYIISSLISVSIMSLAPRGKTFFSELGTRTLAVYFLHAIVIKIFIREEIFLTIGQYFIISVAVTFLFSLKWFSIPFNKILRLDFREREKI